MPDQPTGYRQTDVHRLLRGRCFRGDDGGGNFYVLELAGSLHRFITVKDGRFMDAHVLEYGQSTAFARYETAEYRELLKLIQAAKT